MKLIKDNIAKGIMGIKSVAVVKFIIIMLFVIGLLVGFLLGVFFNEPILDYCGIAIHKEFKERIMDETGNELTDENGEPL